MKKVRTSQTAIFVSLYEHLKIKNKFCKIGNIKTAASILQRLMDMSLTNATSRLQTLKATRPNTEICFVKEVPSLLKRYQSNPIKIDESF